MTKDHTSGNVPINTLHKAYRLFFGTLTSDNRLNIINELRNKEMAVSELVERLGLEQTIVSHNLTRLKMCGFVDVERKGRYRIYSLNKKTILPLMELIDRHMDRFCLSMI